MGHLPPPTRIRVLKEFKRVSRTGVIVGFPVLNSFTSFKFRLGNIMYWLRKRKVRAWWPAPTYQSMCCELFEAGLQIIGQERLIGPFSQIFMLLLGDLAPREMEWRPFVNHVSL
jgi:hypothetical protein